MNLTHLWRRYIGRCQHAGFFGHAGTNEIVCTYCGYKENLR